MTIKEEIRQINSNIAVLDDQARKKGLNTTETVKHKEYKTVKKQLEQVKKVESSYKRLLKKK